MRPDHTSSQNLCLDFCLFAPVGTIFSPSIPLPLEESSLFKCLTQQAPAKTASTEACRKRLSTQQLHSISNYAVCADEEPGVGAIQGLVPVPWPQEAGLGIKPRSPDSRPDFSGPGAVSLLPAPPPAWPE